MLKLNQWSHTFSMTFSGTASVIGVSMKPGRTALHLTPNLRHTQSKGSAVAICLNYISW